MIVTVFTIVANAVDTDTSASSVATVRALPLLSNSSRTVSITPSAEEVEQLVEEVQHRSLHPSSGAASDEGAELAEDGRRREQGREQREDREERRLGRQGQQAVAVGLADDVGHETGEPAERALDRGAGGLCRCGGRPEPARPLADALPGLLHADGRHRLSVGPSRPGSAGCGRRARSGSPRPSRFEVVTHSAPSGATSTVRRRP